MIKCPRCGNSGACGFTWDDENFIIPQKNENEKCGEMRADIKSELKLEIFNFCKKVMNDDAPQPYMIKALPAMINNLLMLLE